MQAHLKVGDRVRLISMADERYPVSAGTTGTVVGIYPHHDWVQVDVDWDGDRSLVLSIPPETLMSEFSRFVLESIAVPRP